MTAGGTSAPEDADQAARKQIMTAVGLIDELRVIALWLTEYGKESGSGPMPPLSREYLDHLTVIPGEFCELRDTYAGLLQKFAREAPTP